MFYKQCLIGYNCKEVAHVDVNICDLTPLQYTFSFCLILCFPSLKGVVPESLPQKTSYIQISESQSIFSGETEP